MYRRLTKITAAVLTVMLLRRLRCCRQGWRRGCCRREGHDGLHIVTSFFRICGCHQCDERCARRHRDQYDRTQTGCLHDYSLKPSDLRLLEDADVFIINGAGMESFLDNVLSQQNDRT